MIIKRCLLLLMMSALSLKSPAQDMKSFKLYKPDENARKALDASVEQAKSSGKNIFVQIGGNWCVWCARFNQFITRDKQIDSLISENYIVYHLNYSPENKNSDILAKLGYPQRFGFPVFIILDNSGNRLHTQNSAYLEEDKNYNRLKVVEFFEQWSPGALKPDRYKDF